MKKIILGILILSSCSGNTGTTTEPSPQVTTVIRNSGTTVEPIRTENSTVHQISKITHTVSGMFGSTRIEFTPGNIFRISTIEEINGSGTLDASDWKKLTDSIDIDTFIAMDQKDERFACKACAYDGDNMESLTIEYATGTKIISYGSENNIAELKKIRENINTISKDISK